MIKHEIKLYSNTLDNLHCVQACLQMVFSHFKLHVPSIVSLDIMTDHIEGNYTQDTSVILFLLNNGFEVKHIEPLDYKKFADFGRSYLKEIFSKKRYEDQDAHGDIDDDQLKAKELVESEAKFEVRLPTLSDIVDAFCDGYIPIISTGSHVVVVTGYDNENFFVNDPGIPASSYVIPRDKFAETLYSGMFVKR